MVEEIMKSSPIVVTLSHWDVFTWDLFRVYFKFQVYGHGSLFYENIV